jgi:DNA-directed RNA polymerase subunit M/transcription elongation factor TFIIS
MSSNIRFCAKCDNKYYHSIDANQLIYYCRVCGNKEENVSKEPLCVLDTQFKENSINFDYIVNKFTKYDPTLPHITLKCPNDKCTTNSSENADNVTDVIYLRYNNSQLKFIYICTVCDHKWKTE